MPVCDEPSGSGVYQIRCLDNGKFYIGSAVNIRARWQGHRWHLANGSHHSKKLQNAWSKHGADRFVFEVVQSVDDKGDLIRVEQEYLDVLRPWERGVGYNVSPTAGSTLGCRADEATLEKLRGREFSEDHRARLSEAARNRSPEVVARASVATAESNRNRVWSDESRAKLSASMKKRMEDPQEKARFVQRITGRKHTPEEIRKISDSSRGRRVTEGAKRAISEKCRLRNSDPAYRARTSEAVKRSRSTPEARARASDAAKRTWAARRWRGMAGDGI